MKREHSLNCFRNKWKEDKGYCSKFDRRSMYKEARNEYNLKTRRISDVKANSFNKKLRTRPQTSNAYFGKIKRDNKSMSDGFQISKNSSHIKGSTSSNSFLNVKAKELQRPIHREDYANIYAVSTSNFLWKLRW